MFIFPKPIATCPFFRLLFCAFFFVFFVLCSVRIFGVTISKYLRNKAHQKCHLPFAICLVLEGCGSSADYLDLSQEPAYMSYLNSGINGTAGLIKS